MAFTDRYSEISFAPAEIERLGAEAPSVVRSGRWKIATRLGLSPERVVYMRQVHGAEVRYVTEPFGDDPPALDGACTDQVGLGIAVLVADCAPVLVAEPVAGVVGAAHAGRSGTRAGVVEALMAAMAAHGAVPSRMTALVGPAACALCYEVSADIRADMAEAIPEAWSVTRRGTPALDLRAAVEAQLVRGGVADVRHDARCTIETPTLYSYRREGPTGDFAGYVWRADLSLTSNSRKAV
jgi:YfiH family protein